MIIELKKEELLRIIYLVCYFGLCQFFIFTGMVGTAIYILADYLILAGYSFSIASIAIYFIMKLGGEIFGKK